MKILIHAINGVGLGHLVRTLEIAKAVLAQTEDAQIVFVTNSAFPDLILQEGFKVYQLKYHANMVLDGTVSYETYLRANYLRIRAVIKKERPDIILMDSEFNSPLVNFCHENKIKTCFVLRKTTDQNFDYLSQKGFLDKIDLVLVPHIEEEISPAQRIILLKYRNVYFVGPIVKSMGAVNKTIKDGIFRILITFAAGSDILDNKELFSKVSDFLAEFKKQKMHIGDKKLQVSIVAGPLFKEGSCNFHGFDHKEFEPDLPSMMAGSDLVVSPAGYNSVNEIISTKTPALLIPLNRKGDDQFVRAKSLEEKGCAVVVASGIWQAFEGVMTADKIEKMRLSFPDISKGNNAAAKRIIDLMQIKSKVLFLRAHWLPLSERFIYDEVASLKRHEPIVLCLHHQDSFDKKFEILSDRRFNGLWNRDYPAVSKEQTDLHSQMLQWARSEIKARDIKILHAEFLSDAIFFLELKRLLGLPLVVSVRGADLYVKRSIDLSAVFAAADIFLVRSEIMKKDLQDKGCPGQKIVVQHSGIILPAKLPVKKLTQNEIRILMTGRMVEKKGTLLGIKIFNKLCEKFDQVKLYVIGDGPRREIVSIAAQQSPFTDKIVLCGALANDKVLELMRKCHVLLHPSITASDGDREGVPGVIMEAMANGLLVVASDNGSIPQIVQHEKTGMIFKEGDIKDAVEKADFVIKNLESLDAMKDRARQKVRTEYSVIDQTEKLETVYDSVVQKDFDQWKKYDRFYSNYQSVINQGHPTFFRADIHPVRGCNSYCVMCDHWKQKKSEFLSQRQIFDVIKELKSIGAQEIRFHGHEPTLRADLLELIDYAKDLGFWVGLKSNCIGLSKDYCKRLARLDKLYVSIDSPLASMHNKMRGNPGSFQDNIRVMSWIKAENPSIILESNSVVTRLNYQTLAGMPQFAKKMGISKVSFVLLNTKNKKEITNLLPKSDQMRELYFKIVPEILRGCVAHGIAFDCSPFFADLVLEDPRTMLTQLKEHPENFEEEINNFITMDYGKTFYQRYGCHGPVDHLSMNYDGHVYPCCVVERVEANAVGNVVNSSFKDVWDSEKYKKIRNDTITSRGTCCAHSTNCASNFGSRKYLAQQIRSSHKQEKVAYER